MAVELRPCSKIAAQRPIGVVVVVMGVGVLVVVMGVGGVGGGDGCRPYTAELVVVVVWRPCSRIAAQRPIGVGVMGVGVLVVMMGVGV